MSASDARFPRSLLPSGLALALAGGALAAVACGPAEGPGGETGADTAAVAAEGDTAPSGVEAPDTVGPAGADSPAAGSPVDTAARRPAARADTARPDTSAPDTVARRWAPGGYMVYVRSGESPDSVAADHGVRPDTVVARLPGFYARLTAEQAAALARDDRVRELARQLEERRPMAEPRGIPAAPDTAGGG